MNTRRIAVLVDGDNISPVHAKRILDEGNKLGRVDIARVYSSGVHQTDWLSMPGYRAIHSGAGKNSADILLCIDAMELALHGEIKTFVVATSDGDFSHLAHRLRERGAHVLGLGEVKAPHCFRLACSAFKVLTNVKPATNTTIKPVAPTINPTPQAKTVVCKVTEFDKHIRTVIEKLSDGKRGIKVERLALEMRQRHGTLISEFQEKNWRGYLSMRPALFELDPRGPEAMVRFRSAAFPTQ